MTAQKLPRKLKKLQPATKEQPARTTRSRKVAKLGTNKPKPETPPKKVVKIAQEELCAKIARRLEYEHAEVYKRFKDRRRTNLKRLAVEVIAQAEVARLIARYKGYEPSELMVAVIEYIRTERPNVEVPEPEPEKPKKERLTARQKEQAANTPAPPPIIDHASARTTRKGRPKTVNPTQHTKADDQRAVQEALDKLLQSNPELKSSCQASALFWDDDDIQALANKLKEVVTQPRRIATLLRQAAKTLAVRYQQEDEATKKVAIDKIPPARRSEPRETVTSAPRSTKPSKAAESPRFASAPSTVNIPEEPGIPDDLMAKIRAASDRLAEPTFQPTP